MKYFKVCLIFFPILLTNLYASTSRLEFKRFQFNNIDRNWWEYVPVTCAQKNCPLVMAFHDEDNSGDRFEDNMKTI